MRRFIIAMLVLSSCTHTQKSAVEEAQSVKCTTVRYANFEQRDFAALTTADDAVNLAFKISGRVENIPIAKGQRVRRGELLAELDRRDVELQMKAAKATYTEAQQRLERGRRLIEHNAISKQEVEALESSAEQAKSAYDNSIDLLKECRIVAPFDGIIERTYVDAYERVSSGQTIVRLVNPISTTVGFTAPENLISVLDKPSTRFEVKFDAFPNVKFSAKIKSFARTSSDALGFPVSLRLVDIDNVKYNISPGMTCIAEIIIPDNKSHTAIVPLTAIYAPISGQDYVWIVNKESRVELRKVKIGELNGSNSVEILEGVDEGEIIVCAGAYKLHENQLVRIIK